MNESGHIAGRHPTVVSQKCKMTKKMTPVRWDINNQGNGLELIGWSKH